MTDKNILITFPKDGMMHPSYATHWKWEHRNSKVDEYVDKVMKQHFLALLFPTLDYRVIQGVVSGVHELVVRETEEFYGVEILLN